MNPLAFSLMASGGYTWFEDLGLPTHLEMPAILGQEAGPVPMVPFYHACLVAILLILSAVIARRAFLSLPSGRDALVPEDRLSMRTAWELFCDGWLAFLRTILGDAAVAHFPLLATLFLFIWFSNLLALLPGFEASTSVLSTNVALAILVVGVYHWNGVKAHGFLAYLKHFLGPVIWLAFLMLPLEIISHMARPLSLSFRLYGNMYGDHTVLTVFLHMTRLFVPVIFLTLGLFVSTVQAFVFSLLTAVYISLATAHTEGSH